MSTENTSLIISMCGFLANKIKFSCLSARKNKKLGEKLGSSMSLIFEQLIPNYCKSNLHNKEAINSLHNLVYLLAHKTQ